LRLTPLAVNGERGFFYARVVMPAQAGTSLPDPSPGRAAPDARGGGERQRASQGEAYPSHKNTELSVVSFQSSAYNLAPKARL